ncbi:MAG: hypothetical protein IJ055_02420 [Oscillospiraceae bacterium]|nr:hypothetical protein [Oscillospiraceae bacterium]
MPAAVQLVCALVSAVCAGVMGIALVPFLEHMRLYEPERAEEKKQDGAGERVRPVMGGLLGVVGTLAGLAAGFALYCRISGADRTALSFQETARGMLLCFLLGLTGALGGFLLDLRDVRRFVQKSGLRLREPCLMFLVSLGFQMLLHAPDTLLTLGTRSVEAGAAALPVRAALMALLWWGIAHFEDGTDGASIGAGCVQLLVLAVLFLQGSTGMYALLMLSAAGGCLGTMVWNLPPARCRLGHTGHHWLGALLSGSVMLQSDLRVALLIGAVYAVGALPRLWRRAPMTLMGAMERAGLTPFQRIALTAGFAAFSGSLLLLP